MNIHTLLRQMSDDMPMPDGMPMPDQPSADAPMNHDDMMNNDGMPHMMSPFLFTDTQNFFVLFKGAFLKSNGAFVAALFLSFLFALLVTIFSQLIRVFETHALHKSAPSPPSKILAACAHGFRQALHYFAMLIVMTMNVWLILAVIFGHALGWLIYSFVLAKKANLFLNNTADIQPKQMQNGCDC